MYLYQLVCNKLLKYNDCLIWPLIELRGRVTLMIMYFPRMFYLPVTDSLHHLSSEIVNWRANIEKQEAQKAILLGLLPSAFYVSSDYSYARTWDEQGFNPQIRALLYFFICLPHAVAFVTAAKMGIFRIFTCCGSKSGLRTDKTRQDNGCIPVILIPCRPHLWCPLSLVNFFAIFASVSVVIAVGWKAASVLVQGPQTKKAMPGKFKTPLSCVQ